MHSFVNYKFVFLYSEKIINKPTFPHPFPARQLAVIKQQEKILFYLTCNKKTRKQENKTLFLFCSVVIHCPHICSDARYVIHRPSNKRLFHEIFLESANVWVMEVLIFMVQKNACPKA